MHAICKKDEKVERSMIVNHFFMCPKDFGDYCRLSGGVFIPRNMNKISPLWLVKIGIGAKLLQSTHASEFVF